MKDDKKFSFGKNWKRYVKGVDTTTIEEAKNSLLSLLDGDTDLIKGRIFLDIGCGSGIFSLAAKLLGASQVTGIDVDIHSIEASQSLGSRQGMDGLQFLHGSILDAGFTGNLPPADIVYAWGSLHHTGEMWTAIDNAASLVKKDGVLVIAIYNRHKTSPFWKKIKSLYNNVPFLAKELMLISYLLINIPYKLLILRTGFKDEGMRGMRIYTDAVDWLGGWPYEYASIGELTAFLEERGFKPKKIIPCHGMTGCNQIVLRKNS